MDRISNKNAKFSIRYIKIEIVLPFFNLGIERKQYTNLLDLHGEN
jgi:hypothetical protein